MNNKIKLIAEIADKFALEEFNNISLRNFRLYTEIFQEKFANLLIKETLELVNDEVSYQLNDVKAMMICETVLEYFGVEEQT